MKNSLLWKVLACVFLLGAGPATGVAKVFKTESRIVEVSEHSVTVAIGHARHSYKITSETLIHVDGKAVSAKHLKKGMPAEVTASLIDPHIATAIEAQHRT